MFPTFADLLDSMYQSARGLLYRVNIKKKKIFYLSQLILLRIVFKKLQGFTTISGATQKCKNNINGSSVTCSVTYENKLITD